MIHIVEDNSTGNDLEGIADSIRKGISQTDIGKSINGWELRTYDSKSFEVVWFPNDNFSSVQEYLRNGGYPYLRIDEDERILVPKNVVGNLEDKFKLRKATIDSLFDEKVPPLYRLIIPANDEDLFIEVHGQIEDHGPINAFLERDNYVVIINERQYRELKKGDKNWKLQYGTVTLSDK